jgi:hypothetical protein
MTRAFALELPAIQGPFKVSLMSLIGTLLIAAGAYLGVGVLVWLAPDLEPDGTQASGLRRNSQKKEAR